MNNGISIQIFTPDSPERLMKAILFINKNEYHFLEIDEILYEYFDTPIKVVYGISDFNEKYSLVNCVFQSTNFSKTLFRIYELYKGCFVEKATEKIFIEVEASITSLTNWIDYSVNQLSFSLGEEGRVSIKKPFQIQFEVENIGTIELTKYSEVTRHNDEINLKSKSHLKFRCSSRSTRIILHDHVEAFSKLLFLFIEGIPKISAISFTNTQNEVITKLLSTNNQNENLRDSFVLFSNVEKYLQIALNLFYCRKSSFVEVINFIISSYRNKSPENAFLNITTAFEIYHENFKPKIEAIQVQLYLELIGKVPFTKKEKEWTQIIRTYDLVKSVIHLKYFKENIPELKKITHLIKDSRNYYTHYNYSIKEIWSPNELLKYNKLLRELLKALILIELKFPDDIIEKILRAKPAIFYQNFDHNEFSILFKNDLE